MDTYINNIKNSNVEAYWELFDREFPKCYTFAYGFTKNEVAAESVVRSAMLRLWTERGEIQEGEVCEDVLLRLLRKELSLYFASIVTQPKNDDKIKLTKRSGKGRMVSNSEVESMPERRREIFLLSRREGLTNAQIAQQMNISVRTVEKHIELAMKQLGEKLN